MLLDACEQAAVASRLSSLRDGRDAEWSSPVPARGYVSLENLAVPLANGEALPIVRMEKRLPVTPHVRAPGSTPVPFPDFPVRFIL